MADGPLPVPDFAPALVPYSFDLGRAARNSSTAGSFWRRFREIYREYSNRTVRIREGFVEPRVTLDDFETTWTGVITDMSLTDAGGLTLNASDLLGLAREEIPAAISDDNVLQAAVDDAATVLEVADGSEFTDPAEQAPPVLLELSFGDEAVTPETVVLTSVDGDELTVQRGAWGTAPVAHLAGARIREVVEFGIDAGGVPLSKNPVDVIVDDLLPRAGIGSESIDTAAF